MLVKNENMELILRGGNFFLESEGNYYRERGKQEKERG